MRHRQYFHHKTEQQQFDQNLLKTIRTVQTRIRPPKSQFWDVVADLMKSNVDKVALRYNQLYILHKKGQKELSQRLTEEDRMQIEHIDINFEDIMVFNLTDNVTAEKINVYKRTVLQIPYLKNLLLIQGQAKDSHFNIQCDISTFKHIIRLIENNFNRDLLFSELNPCTTQNMFLLSRYFQIEEIPKMYLDQLIVDPSFDLPVTLADSDVVYLLSTQSPFYYSQNEGIFAQITSFLVTKYQKINFIKCKQCGYITQYHYSTQTPPSRCTHQFIIENNVVSSIGRLFLRFQNEKMTNIQLLLAFFGLTLRVGYEVQSKYHECLLQDVMRGQPRERGEKESQKHSHVFSMENLREAKLLVITEQLFVHITIADLEEILTQEQVFNAVFIQRIYHTHGSKHKQMPLKSIVTWKKKSNVDYSKFLGASGMQQSEVGNTTDTQQQSQDLGGLEMEDVSKRLFFQEDSAQDLQKINIHNNDSLQKQFLLMLDVQWKIFEGL